MKFTLLKSKQAPTQDSTGVLTPKGMRVAHDYARHWVEKGTRNLEIERSYPELEGLFYDIRIDTELARGHSL